MITIKNFKSAREDVKYPVEHLDITKPLTIISGANGYGKSTLLDSIQKSLEASVKSKFDDILKIDPTSSLHSIKGDLDKSSMPYYKSLPKMIIASYDAYASCGYHSMLGVAMSAPHMSIKRFELSEGQVKIFDLRRLFELVDYALSFGEKIPVFILLDGVDSGLSPDVAIHLRQEIESFVTSHLEDNVYVIMTSNTFEILENTPSFGKVIDGKTLQEKQFLSYQDYVDYCKETSSLKDSLESRQIYS